MKIDLHIHTNNSDGCFSQKEIIKKIEQSNLNVFSITDHDSIDFYKQTDFENKNDCHLIVGVELSTRMSIPIHILGYGIDLTNKDLLDYLEKVKINRISEIKKVIGLLKENGISINIIDLLKNGKKLNIKTLEQYVVEKEYCISIDDARKKYFSIGGCAYIEKKCIDTVEAIKLIHNCDGIAVLAHPNRIPLSKDNKIELFNSLINAGLDGIEIYCKEMDELDFYKNYCIDKNLLISGGSDFHSDNEKLGCYNENLIPDDLSILNYFRI